MKNFTRILIVLALIVQPGLSACATAGPQRTSIEAPKSVLFVGNSFTYYNNSLHNHLRLLMRAAGKPTGRMRAWTLSGARLSEHAAGMQAIVDSADWDVVVLQGHSLEAIEDDSVDAFRQAARDYRKVIAASGAATVFFMTWAYEDHPEYTPILNDRYTAIGNELDALVVPVGLAFAAATAQYPEVQLRTADSRHPTLAGTYLAACTFYAALFGETPVGSGYDAGLDPQTATNLQATAWKEVSRYFGK